MEGMGITPSGLVEANRRSGPASMQQEGASGGWHTRTMIRLLYDDDCVFGVIFIRFSVESSEFAEFSTCYSKIFLFPVYWLYSSYQISDCTLCHRNRIFCNSVTWRALLILDYQITMLLGIITSLESPGIFPSFFEARKVLEHGFALRILESGMETSLKVLASVKRLFGFPHVPYTDSVDPELPCLRCRQSSYSCYSVNLFTTNFSTQTSMPTCKNFSGRSSYGQTGQPPIDQKLGLVVVVRNSLPQTRGQIFI